MQFLHVALVLTLAVFQSRSDYVLVRSVVNGKSDGPKSAAATTPTSALTLHADEPNKDLAATDDSLERGQMHVEPSRRPLPGQSQHSSPLR